MEQREVKEMLKAKQEERDKEILQLLLRKGTYPSVSSQIFSDWELTRRRIKEILRFLEQDRKLQVTFTNLIGATRYKTTGKGKLYVTLRPKCKVGLDNWGYHKECYKLQILSIEDTDSQKAWLTLVRGYTGRIATEKPAKYVASRVRYEDIYGKEKEQE